MRLYNSYHLFLIIWKSNWINIWIKTCLREVHVRIMRIRRRVGIKRGSDGCVLRQPRHGPQHAPSPVPHPAALVLRTRDVKTSRIFWWAWWRASWTNPFPVQLLLRRWDLVPKSVEVVVPESFLLKKFWIRLLEKQCYGVRILRIRV